MSLATAYPAPPADSPDALPQAVERLLHAASTTDSDTAWQTFVERYSRLLLRVAFAFAPGYDGAMDRYAFILDELRRDDHSRLRRFAADGRGRFSTWLVVVARRLCVDHHRRSYGRSRGKRSDAGTSRRLARRRLHDLSGDPERLDNLGDETGPDPVELLDREQRSIRLRRILETLPAEDQLLLRLRYEQDLTAREIAGLLGLPTPFHVYRRARALCEQVRARLAPAPSADRGGCA